MRSIFKFLKKQKNIFTLSIIVLIIVIILFIILKLIIKKPPIKIGFVNTLTGFASTSTIKIRDLTVLAVEQINNKGGIHGRKIELIIRDDKFDSEIALRVDKELIDEGVVAIIGHSFSSLCLKVAPLINKHNIIMISPTVQSAELTGRDDNFLRLNIPLDKDAVAIAQIALIKFNLKKIAVVYDLINSGLTEPTSIYFKNEVEKLGGKISAGISFNSKEKFVAKDITKEIIESGADGVYIISDAIHAALICQHLRINSSKIKIIVHGWAFIDPVFISEGGRAIEGVISTYLTDLNLANENYLKFEDEYKERYGDVITGPAQLTYEALHILFNALLMTTEPKKLKDIILKQKEYEGIDGKITFDKFGDPIRSLHIMEIQNGKPKNIGEIEVK